MQWLFYAILGSLCMELYAVAVRVFLKDKGDAKSFAFITTLAGSVGLFLIVSFEELRYLVSGKIIILLIIIGLIFALTDFFYISGRKLEEIAVVTVVAQAGHLWALLSGLLLFHERITAAKVVGVILITLGNLLVVWTGQKITFSKGMLYVLSGSFFFALGVSLDKIVVADFTPALYKAILFFLEALWLVVLIPSPKIASLRNEFSLQSWKILLVGPLLAFANYFLMRSFQANGEASKVLPIFGTSLILASFIGMLFLGERQNVLRKIAAIAAVFGGTYILQAW